MQIKNSSKEFTFLNAPAALISSVKQVLDYIEQRLIGVEYKPEIYFKTKLVVTELLTNAIKHAGTQIVTIQIDIDAEYLTITKSEYGQPFPLVVSDVFPDTRKKLSYDIMHSLYAIKESNNTIRFIVEDNLNDTPDINSVAEHFGLLIVTKCAEEFIYHYDQDAKLNTFMVKVLMPEF